MKVLPQFAALTTTSTTTLTGTFAELNSTNSVTSRTVSPSVLQGYSAMFAVIQFPPTEESRVSRDADSPR
ncbi:MAG: hypothetical protein U0231_04535 [Nitrospiraceae bacterium]